MSAPGAYVPHRRLQTKEGICDYLGGIAPATYDLWQGKGLVPGPVAGTSRYDVRAHDHLLDRKAGLGAPVESLSALEQWERDHGRAA